MARLPRLKGIDLHARFGGTLDIKRDCIPGPSSKYQLTETERAAHAVPSHVQDAKARRSSILDNVGRRQRAPTSPARCCFGVRAPPLPSISSRRPNVKQGAVTSHVVLDPLPAGFFAAPSSPPFNYPKHMVMTFGGRPQEGPMQGAGRLSRTARSCSATSRRAADVAKLPTWPLAVQECSDSLRSKERAFGVRAVNDGLAATSARGRLPPQGNRKAGTGPGGRNGEVVENMETKTRKRRLPKD
ncbi:hypothetical protein MCOR05_001744 [Pyricularia oryzae]|uniref:Uncharacterized protein n=1 Tax=Pyricularia grisea TaxID=148305 RepID=A0ABQ8NUR9_PYRGI|nr:hypothetical protein MCOR33_002991 [Pyricularia grisea]KAI6545158.1 hypothetical protein MCOR05_001744 [Pyricularia oryzae]